MGLICIHSIPPFHTLKSGPTGCGSHIHLLSDSTSGFGVGFFFFFWLVDRANGFKQPSGRRLREQNLQKRGLLELAFRTEKSRKGQECNKSQ